MQKGKSNTSKARQTPKGILAVLPSGFNNALRRISFRLYQPLAVKNLKTTFVGS